MKLTLKKLIKVAFIALFISGFVDVKSNVLGYQDAIVKALHNHIDTLHNKVIATIGSVTEKQLESSIKQMAIDRLNKIAQSFKTLDPETLARCKSWWSDWLYNFPVIFKEYADALYYTFSLIYNNCRSDDSESTRSLLNSLYSYHLLFKDIQWGFDKTVQNLLVRLNNFKANVSNLLSYHIHKLQKLLLPEALSLASKISKYPAAELMYKNMSIIHKNVIDTIASVPNCGLSYLEKKNIIEKLNYIVKTFGQTTLEDLTVKNLWKFVFPNALFKQYGAVLDNCHQALQHKLWLDNCHQALQHKLWDVDCALASVERKIFKRHLFFSYSHMFENSPIFDSLKEIRSKIDKEYKTRMFRVFTGGFIAGAVSIGALYYFSPNIFVYLCKNNYLRSVRLILQGCNNQLISRLLTYNDCECLLAATKNGHKEMVELLLNRTEIDLSARNYEAVFYALKNNNKELIKLFFDRIAVLGNFNFNEMIHSIRRQSEEKLNNKTLSDEEAREILGPHFIYYNRTDFGQDRIGLGKDQLIEFYKQKLIYGCFLNDPTIIKSSYQNIRKLTDNVYNINTLSYDVNDSLLHFAVRYNNKESVKTLLKLGHNPSCVNKYGDTPLQLAKKKNYDDMVEILLTSEFIDVEKISGTEKRLETIDTLEKIENKNDTNVIKPRLGKFVAKNIVSFISKDNL